MLVSKCTNLDAVLADIRKMKFEKVPDGSGQARGNGTHEGWITGLWNRRLYHSDGRYPDALRRTMGISSAIQTLSQHLHNVPDHRNSHPLIVRQVMVNALEPHSALAPHRDGPPADLRFHLPVVTSPEVEWWDEINGPLHMELGNWYGPVNYCGILHAMRNDSDKARVHLVVDYVT